MSSIKKLASQTAIYGLSSIIGRLVVWGLTPFYTGQLTTTEYGIFSDLYVFITYFLVILTFGMETSFFRFSMNDKLGTKPYDQSFLFVAVMSSLFMLVFGVFHQPFASVLGYGNRPILVLMTVVIIFLDVIIALPMAKLRHDERPVVFAVVSLFNILLIVILNIWFIVILKMDTVEYIFLANIIASLVKLLMLVVISLPLPQVWDRLGKFGAKVKGINLLPKTLKPDPVMLKEMSAFGFFIMLAGLSGMINQNSDVNFIKRVWEDGGEWAGRAMTSEEMAGIYAAVRKLAVMILLVTQAFRYAAEPFFFRHAKGSDSRVVFARVFHYFMLASLAVFLLVGSFSYEFVSIRIFGFQLIHKNFWPGLDVVPLLLFSYVLSGAYINLSIWFKITKQVRFGLLFSLIGTVLIVVLNLTLIPFWGYFGAGISMLACYTAMTALCYFTGQKYYPIPYKMGRIGLYFAIILLAFFLNLSIGNEVVFSMIFWKKLVISFGSLGVILLTEKFMPIDWTNSGKGPLKGDDSGGKGDGKVGESRKDNVLKKKNDLDQEP